MNKKGYAHIIVGLIIVGVFCFFAGVITGENKELKNVDFTPSSIPNSEQEILDNCDYSNITYFAFCIRDNIATFYEYVNTEEEYSTVQELREKGGDCYNYAMLYERLGREAGFEATTRRYDGFLDVFSSHRWAIMWDDNYICTLDLLEIKCVEREK